MSVVDITTRYTLIYFLQKKSGATRIFVEFHNKDGGGEYKPLTPYLYKNVLIIVSCGLKPLNKMEFFGPRPRLYLNTREDPLNTPELITLGEDKSHDLHVTRMDDFQPTRRTSHTLHKRFYKIKAYKKLAPPTNDTSTLSTPSTRNEVYMTDEGRPNCLNTSEHPNITLTKQRLKKDLSLQGPLHNIDAHLDLIMRQNLAVTLNLSA